MGRKFRTAEFTAIPPCPKPAKACRCSSPDAFLVGYLTSFSADATIEGA